MAIDPNIKKKADDIRNKIYGKEVRESLASGLEEMSSDVVENEGRQSVVEGRQDSVESQWQVVSDEVIKASNEAVKTSNEANQISREANDKSDYTQVQLDTVTGASTIDPAVEQLKVGSDSQTYPSPDARIRSEHEKVTTQLGQTAGLGNYTETPIYENGLLKEIIKSDGTKTFFTYNEDGTLETVRETILGRGVVTTLHYTDGTFTHLTKQTGDELPVTHPSTLIASIDDYYVNYVDDTLLLSVDRGRTYTRRLSIPNIEVIKYIHLFENGELLFCDHTKVYYSHDWLTYNESTVLDIDGNPFVPTQYDNFTSYKHNHNRQVVNGIEMLTWGNYTNATGTMRMNINVWYTIDKGKTIKSCYKFRSEQMDTDNPALFTKHIHNVNFNPKDETFWLSTGDHINSGVDERHLLKGLYNTTDDSWTWELMGSGNNYKVSNLVFYENDVYWAWDVTPGGVVKCPYNDEAIKDPSQHELIMSTDMDCIMVYIGERGDMVVLQIAYGLSSYTGDKRPRYIYYSQDRVNFVKIEGYIPPEVEHDRAWYYSNWAPNNEGKLLTGVYTPSINLSNWNLTPSVFLDDMIRNAGYPNAFKPL